MPAIENYLDNTTPRGPQQAGFDFTAGRKTSALLFEQRVGKTPTALARVALSAERGETTGALIVAMPSGVPQNWLDEIQGDPTLNRPPRWPARIPYKALVWRANKAKQVGFKTALEELLNTDAYAILLVNGEAILTDEFKKFAGKFLRKRKVFAVADETSLLIKSPSAKRTKVMNGIKKLTEYRGRREPSRSLQPDRMARRKVPGPRLLFQLQEPLRRVGEGLRPAHAPRVPEANRLQEPARAAAAIGGLFYAGPAQGLFRHAGQNLSTVPIPPVPHPAARLRRDRGGQRGDPH